MVNAGGLLIICPRRVEVSYATEYAQPKIIQMSILTLKLQRSVFTISDEINNMTVLPGSSTYAPDGRKKC